MQTNRNVEFTDSTYSMDSSADCGSTSFSVNRGWQALSISARVLSRSLIGNIELSCNYSFDISHMWHVNFLRMALLLLDIYLRFLGCRRHKRQIEYGREELQNCSSDIDISHLQILEKSLDWSHCSHVMIIIPLRERYSSSRFRILYFF